MLRTAFFGMVLSFLALISVLLYLLPIEADPEAGQPDQAESGMLVTDDKPMFSADLGNSYILTNVRRWRGGTLRENERLIVKEGIIVSSENAEGDLQIVDGQGLTIIPGLIDAHTHSWGNALSDALRFGVTTQLDMFTGTTVLIGKRNARENLTRTDKADLYSSATLATVPGGHGTQFGLTIDTLTTPEEAPDWVDARITEGADFIKLVYIPGQDRIPSLNRATAKAVIDAAHERGMMAMAHISTQAAARDLIEDGIDGLVHIFADEPVSPDLVEMAIEADLFVVPTLAVLAMVDGQSQGPALIDDPRAKPFLSGSQRQTLSGSFGMGPYPGFDLEIGLANTKALYDAGIPILAGSDAPNPGTTYGASLHQEMALLVRAGLPVPAAIAAATRLPAKVFNLAGRGAIEAGYRADFLLIDGDPYTDINATLNIAAIVKNGFPVQRGEVDADRSTMSRWTQTNLGTFDENFSVSGTPGWTTTTDEIAGGRSQISLSHETDADENGVMVVNADITPDFFVPWAGAFLPLSTDFAAGFDLSGYEAIEFTASGTPGDYRLMAFMPDGAGAPPSGLFSLSEEQKLIRVRFQDMPGLDPTSITGLAIVAGPKAGKYQFVIDNVTLK